MFKVLTVVGQVAMSATLARIRLLASAVPKEAFTPAFVKSAIKLDEQALQAVLVAHVDRQVLAFATFKIVVASGVCCN